ncbi:F-box and leucine-rich repeat protein 13 isoform X2 [Hoplias malabaricus]|uniref:F-box and leucine-rich repeat protein 13 isoform X2 n=1 Tax=Hoplias malabaricus TaxID=27720 RepID=UPI003461FD1E
MNYPAISDPVLKYYFMKHSLSQIFKVLLMGLCISRPKDPLLYIAKKVLAVLDCQKAGIDWHTCFDDVEQDTVCLLPQTLMLDICGDPDEKIQSHVLEKAYSCYRKTLTTMCFKGWRQYVMRRRAKATRLLFMTQAAERHHTLRNLRHVFTCWVEWVEFRKKKKTYAVKKIQGVWNAFLFKNIIAEWCCVVQNSKRKREFFKSLGKDALDNHSQHTELSQTNGPDRLSLLPWKLLVKIFQYLGVGDLLKCSQVCEAWNAIVQNPCLWSWVDFSTERHWNNRTVKKILNSYHIFVTYLNLSDCIKLQHECFTCISQCKNLQELNLSKCTSISDEIVRMILEECSSLLSLNLSHTNVTNGTLIALSRCSLNLQCLNLAYCKYLNDVGFEFLATGQGCHRLTHLDLSGCVQISVDGFRHIAKSCSGLQHIVLDYMPMLSNACIQALVSTCHSLTVISLVDSQNLTDTAFKAIAEVSSLTTLKIEGNRCLTDSSWKALCRSSPHLTVLHVADCCNMTDASVKYIASLRNISILHIADFVKLSDTGIHYIADGPSASKLQELNLSNCPHISDQSIMRLTQRCSKLNYLSLCYCENLTDEGFKWLGSCSSLVTLDITGCNIQDQGLAALSVNQSLRKLIAAGCERLTDTGIEKFCKQVRELELLDLSHCLYVSDRSIKVLSFYCRHIITLHIAGCPKFLSGACHYLRELDLSGCVLLTDRTPHSLQRGCPQLYSISMLYCGNISRRAALNLQPRVKHWQYSNDDVPYSFGYNSLGQLLQLIRRPEQMESQREDEEPVFNNSSTEEPAGH